MRRRSPSSPSSRDRAPEGDSFQQTNLGLTSSSAWGEGTGLRFGPPEKLKPLARATASATDFRWGQAGRPFPHRTWLESSEKTPSLGMAGFIIGNTDAQVCWQPLLPPHRNFVENEATQGGSGFKRQRGSFLGSLHVPLKPRHPRTSLIQKTYVTLNRASVHCS